MSEIRLEIKMKTTSDTCTTLIPLFSIQIRLFFENNNLFLKRLKFFKLQVSQSLISSWGVCQNRGGTVVAHKKVKVAVAFSSVSLE